MSDLASITFLTALIDNQLVIDITLMGSDGDYTMAVYLADMDTIFGRGTSLPEAISDAHAKFEAKRNEYRN